MRNIGFNIAESFSKSFIDPRNFLWNEYSNEVLGYRKATSLMRFFDMDGRNL